MGSMEQWLKRARSRSFWTEMCPDLHIGGPQPEPVIRMDRALRHELRHALLSEGYYQFPPILPLDVIQRMRDAVTTMHGARLPMGLCYIYDEFWYLTRWVDEVLVAVLGEGYRRLPDNWAWYVEPGTTGWGPHRDKDAKALTPSGCPKSLSLWIPLSDATPDNGCMHIVPANMDPHYGKPELVVAVDDLRTIRALPAKAGSVLMWSQALLHWGGACSPDATNPRVSFSIEYQRGDLLPFNQPLINPNTPLPSFEQRLALAGKQIVQYKHMFKPGSHILDMGRGLRSLHPIMALHDEGPPLPSRLRPAQ